MSQSLSTSAVKEVLQKPRYKTDMTKNKQKTNKNQEKIRKKKHTHTISHNFFITTAPEDHLWRVLRSLNLRILDCFHSCFVELVELEIGNNS